MVKPNEPKRKSETQPQANAKKQKTKDIRKKQNGVASSICADKITFGRGQGTLIENKCLKYYKS